MARSMPSARLCHTTPVFPAMTSKTPMRVIRTFTAPTPLATEIPIDAATWRHDAGDLLAEKLFQRRLPRYELKSHSIINHGKPPGR